ncbi:MAG: hypothetical protein A2X94_07195 [Bdellovibrionales bacterium GWB1_55_8]|nr:MAG: hypothetical protein A2X94_07195 [Bdellovibrionales bacterium GWB1_55_8]
MLRTILFFLTVLTFSINSHAVDTSGCSPLWAGTQSDHPVQVTAEKAPKRECWNIASSGLRVSYRWVQINSREPENKNIGFWISLNGKAQYAKARYYECRSLSGTGYGHDTSGNAQYLCAATQVFRFQDYPQLMQYAYGSDGLPNFWDVSVAVSLDDHGNWESRNGYNYRFRF